MLDLALDLERDDGAEQRDALDERGKDQRGRLDLAGSFRLARHTLDGLAADAAAADAGSDDGEAATETRADGHHRDPGLNGHPQPLGRVPGAWRAKPTRLDSFTSMCGFSDEADEHARE